MRARGLPLAGVLLLALAAFTAGAAQARCLPSLVRSFESDVPLLRASLRLAQGRGDTPAQERGVTLRYLGHSSFLLISSRNTVVLTDPNALYPVDIAPHAITVSNDHFTHSNLSSVMPRLEHDPVILRGSGPVTSQESAATRVGEVLIERLPSNLAGDPASGMHAGNGIFLFSVDDLCIAHFGNLRQHLSERQLTALGRVDVMLVPIDQWVTIGYDIVVELMASVRPAWVVPMHYDDPNHPDVFLGYLAADPRSRQVGHRKLSARSLRITREILPTKTEVLIFGALPTSQ